MSSLVAVLLALLAAASFGVSDFAAGVASRRASAAVVGTVVQLCGGSAALLVALAGSFPVTSRVVAWGAVAGIGSAVGTVALYRGLAVGHMAVVAPVSAVVSAALPVLLGVLLGERPGVLPWTGILLAVPATALVSSVGTVDPHRVQSSGLAEGLLAGLGFAVLYIGLNRAGDGAGTWPVAVEMLLSVLLIAPVALALRGRSRPTSRQALGEAAGAGVLGAAAGVLFLVASVGGGLAIASVVTSLYPAFTVLLARLVLSERIRGVQVVGLVVAALSVVLVASG